MGRSIEEIAAKKDDNERFSCTVLALQRHYKAEGSEQSRRCQVEKKMSASHSAERPS